MLGKVRVLVSVGSVQIISQLDSQSKFQMFTLFSGRHIDAPKRRLRTGGPVSLRSTFRRISEVWKNGKA